MRVVAPEVYERLIAKVKWASEHIRNLQAVCDRFDESHPYRIEREHDTQAGQLVYYLRSIKPVPQEVPLIAGDILSNLRSALDHCIWHLVQRNATLPNRRDVYFPIRDSATDYQLPGFRRKIQHLGQDVIDVLDQIKPYKGGNDELWRLKELNNLDKHKLLVTIASVHPARSETLADREKARDGWAREHPGKTFPFPDNIRRFIPADAPKKTLKTGDELLRVPDSEMNEQPQLLIEVALAEVGVAEGEPLVPALHEIKMMVLRTIGKLTDLL
ncbi:MAG: hypothetical protein WB558_17950 [Terriglobales bacterium]